ncbi:MAG: agmatine deiminase family protein [Sulfuricurvum sp.]
MKRLIAEFEPQSFTQVIFPHANSDWREYLEEAEDNFVRIINEIIKHQKCLVVCANKEYVKSLFEPNKNLHFVEYETNDTWARDSSAICVQNGDDIKLLDFIFTGWGGKFESCKDNAMSRSIKHCYSKDLKSIDFILEGGGIESDGAGRILTTSHCMLNQNRNHALSKDEITARLKEYFAAEEILYIDHGYLAGDDTDSHIDTLARFISPDTIAYVKCTDENDEHFKELSLMEAELKGIAKEFGYRLVALPMSEAIYFEGERLPATYANFLFVNGALLVPTYGVKEDALALEILRTALPHLEVVGIDCLTLIKQHGSLHCVTMNFAKGVDLL